MRGAVRAMLASAALRRTGAFAFRRAPACRALAAARSGYDPRGAEPCEATIASFGPLGASVDVAFADGRVGRGLVLQAELRFLREARLGAGAEAGETFDAFAVAARDDGKLDVTLRPPTAKGKSDDARKQILAALEAAGGVLPLGDKSPPGAIAAALPGLSKSVFKNAIGSLYREGRVEPDRLETRVAAAAARAPPPGRQPVLFLANLPFDADWEALRRAVDATARRPVRRGGLRRKRDGTSSGCAHVEFGSVADAEAALAALDGATFRGRALRVEWARDGTKEA